MVSAVAHYVRAKQHAFPHGERLVSGPFDTSAAAWGEMQRLRPLYADCGLAAVRERCKGPPPVRVPRGAFNLRDVAGRREATDAIADHCRNLGATVDVEAWPGAEFDVNIALPSLRANVWIAWTPLAPLPIVSWFAAERPLRRVMLDAWGDGGGRKATSEPASWSQLFEMLTYGICAAVDGTAFNLETEK